MTFVTVVAPCFDEAPCVERLVREVDAVLEQLDLESELIVVDDASEDHTLARLQSLAQTCPRLRVAAHERRCGQSAALATGIGLARGDVVVTMDGDGQHDPRDIPALLAALGEGRDAVCGVRTERNDNWVRRLSSRIGNGFRRVVTGDPGRDAGCTFRAVRRQALSELPVFDGTHRFLPALLRLQGFVVVEQPVRHRPRLAGRAKYGIRNRLARGLIDCLVMRWWRARAVPARRLASETSLLSLAASVDARATPCAPAAPDAPAGPGVPAVPGALPGDRERR